MFAISTLLLVVALSLVVTRVATAILTATGMSRQSARFQARSAFTGSGFTTSEAEDVVNHPVRRKVIMWLMFLGNAGIVAGAGTLIIGFRHGSTGKAWWRMLELGLGLIALLYISRNRWIDRKLTAAIQRVLARYSDLPTRGRESLADLADGWLVSELAVAEGDWLSGGDLSLLGVGDEGVTVLGITRADGRYVSTPDSGAQVMPGDVLVLYGHEVDVSGLDHRPTGPEGDSAHRAGVRRHRERLERSAREHPPMDDVQTD